MQCAAESKACLLCKALCCLNCLLHSFRHSTASAHAVCLNNCTACRAYERMYIHTGHKAGSPALQCTAESKACLLCKALCCFICLLHGFRHSTASAHAVCLNNCTACRAYERVYVHTGQNAGSSPLQCTAESKACLLCKAFCGLICSLHGFRHSTASAHALCLDSCTACRAYERMYVLTGQNAGSSPLQCTAESKACMVCKALCCLSCLLHGFRHSTASAHAVCLNNCTACRAYERMYVHTGQKAGSPALQCTAESKACLLCKAICGLICLLHGFRHFTASAHAVCLNNCTACRAYERMYVHTGHNAGSSPLQCAAESKACLLCKALCCFICLLHGFRHSTASAHTVCLNNCTACRAYERVYVHTGQNAGSSPLQCTAESKACLLCKALGCLICLLHGFRHSTASAHAVCLNNCTACRAYERMYVHTGQKAGSPALQCTAESKACLLCKAICGLICLLHGFRHFTASAHAVCLNNCTACRAYERMYVHTGHNAGSSPLQCAAESKACLLCKALCCFICLLHGFRHSTASAHTVCLNNCTACRAYERVYVHTGQNAGSSPLQCTAESKACLLCKALGCLICLLHGFRHSTASAHAVCLNNCTACRAYERMYVHTGQKAGSPALQCTAESKACLLCKAICGLICLLHGFRHFTASAHAVCLNNCTACRAYERMYVHTGHNAGSSPLQCAAESKACLLCKALCCLSCLLHSFRHSTASAHAVCLNNCTACRVYERMCIHTGHKAGSPALQCTAESKACLLCKAFCGLICSLHGFRHSTASAHALCLDSCTACRAYERMYVHTGQNAGSSPLQCTAESKTCMVCKALCCLICLLHGFRHSTA